MRYHSFQKNYHDAQLAAFTLGPSHELMLQIALDPVWNRHINASATHFGDIEAMIRFSGIKNYQQVAEYFKKLPPAKADGYIAEIIGVVQLKEGPHGFLLDIHRHGSIEIHSNDITEI